MISRDAINAPYGCHVYWGLKFHSLQYWYSMIDLCHQNASGDISSVKNYMC